TPQIPDPGLSELDPAEPEIELLDLPEQNTAEPEAPSDEPGQRTLTPTLTMPPSEASALAHHYAQHDVILEYGSGGSTLLAAGQDHSLVMSVESDKAWAEKMQAELDRDYPGANVRMHWVDIGPTGEWGRPLD